MQQGAEDSADFEVALRAAAGGRKQGGWVIARVQVYLWFLAHRQLRYGMVRIGNPCPTAHTRPGFDGSSRNPFR